MTFETRPFELPAFPGYAEALRELRVFYRGFDARDGYRLDRELNRGQKSQVTKRWRDLRRLDWQMNAVGGDFAFVRARTEKATNVARQNLMDVDIPKGMKRVPVRVTSIKAVEEGRLKVGIDTKRGTIRREGANYTEEDVAVPARTAVNDTSLLGFIKGMVGAYGATSTYFVRAGDHIYGAGEGKHKAAPGRSLKWHRKNAWDFPDGRPWYWPGTDFWEGISMEEEQAIAQLFDAVKDIQMKYGQEAGHDPTDPNSHHWKNWFQGFKVFAPKRSEESTWELVLKLQDEMNRRKRERETLRANAKREQKALAKQREKAARQAAKAGKANK